LTSGWNCSPRTRPTLNAWAATGVRAIRAAPGGSVNRSKCQENHGPAGIRPGADVASEIQPISGAGASDTDPPSAVASICPPKQIPSRGTPSAIADRTNAISSPIQVPIVAVSYTDHGAP
jgi:hypothetical protein